MIKQIAKAKCKVVTIGDLKFLYQVQDQLGKYLSTDLIVDLLKERHE